MNLNTLNVQLKPYHYLLQGVKTKDYAFVKIIDTRTVNEIGSMDFSFHSLFSFTKNTHPGSFRLNQPIAEQALKVIYRAFEQEVTIIKHKNRKNN